MEDSTPFDALASTYDVDFTGSPLARELRGRVQARLAVLFPAGTSVLELGCGTGEDALWLARRGVHVLATDSSPAMLEQARLKTAGEPLVTVQPLDLSALPAVGVRQLDGVFSNFGPLNCLPGWRDLAHWLAIRMAPGAPAAFGVMSRYCLWETAWHGLHGHLGTAFRRWDGHATFRLAADDLPLAITYPTVRAFTTAFDPWFRRVRLLPLGVFLPPTDAYGVVEPRPRLSQTLSALDRRFGRFGWQANIADHFWIEFVRTDAPA